MQVSTIAATREPRRRDPDLRKKERQMTNSFDTQDRAQVRSLGLDTRPVSPSPRGSSISLSGLAALGRRSSPLLVEEEDIRAAA